MLECTLKLLAVNRIRELAQEAFNRHEDIMRRMPELDSVERTQASVSLKSALEQQRKWIDALGDELEKEQADAK